MSTDLTLETRLRTLAEFAPSSWPVLSLYLNTQSNEHGRQDFDAWLRRELANRGRTFKSGSNEAKSFEADCGRIQNWLAEQRDPATKCVAIFACFGAGEFFDAVQLEAPIEKSELYIQDQPHLYPLARLIDQYPRYAAVVGNTNSARIAVFGLNRLQSAEKVQNVKTNRSTVGGWSQARFQRHVDNFHKQHAKEVIDVLERIVRDEGIKHVVLAGDQEVVIPLLKAEMPKHLAEMVVDVLKLDPTVGDQVLLERSMEALRMDDERRDAEKVEYLRSEFRSGGLAVAGVVDTFTALEKGQADELVLAASPSAIDTPEEALAVTPETADAPVSDPETRAKLIADALVTTAQKTSAKVSFIEQSELLADLGGCGAFLRYKV
jgi:peptide chain release factor subunit 1